MTSPAISPEDYQQIKCIVTEYLDLSTFAQPSYLKQIAADHPNLIKTIEGMIGFAAQDSEFILDTLPIKLDRSIEIEESFFSEDDQFKFQLNEQLSQSGHSQVYRGTQNRPIEREVAIKFLSRLPKQSLLLAEAEFLARLNHPNIATLYEFGETKDGRLFIVMELISGDDLISYAEKHHLSIQEKIELFKQLCLGIAHAHEKGIIHCDIKPSNILVSEVDNQPTVKIIDFGVSKFQRLTKESSTPSGTPSYMAPESLEGELSMVDTRNDVYSMGVLLHRLLCGFMPDHESQSKTSLHKDLQAIISKAMHTERIERYGNSVELANDLNRHLNKDLVKARSPSFVYRISRLFLKYKLPAVVFTAFLLTIGAGYYAQSLQATAAKKAQVEAEEVTSFVIDLLSTADPKVNAEQISTIDLVLNAKDQLLAKEQPTLTDATFMHTIGEMLYRLDRQQDALVVSRESYGIRRKLTSDTAYELLPHLTQLAKIHRKRLAYDEAKQVLLEALDIQNKYNPEPRQLSFIHNQLGNLYFDLKDNHKSIEHHKQALLFRTEINDQKLIGDSLNNIGAQYYDMKQWELSGEYFNRALAIFKREYEADHAYNYFVINNLATIAEKSHQWDLAESRFKEAIAGLSRIYGPSHFNTLRAHTNLGRMYARFDRYTDAIAVFNQVLARYTENEDDYNRIRLLALIGEAYTNNGQFSLSEENFNSALEIETQMESTDHYAMGLLHLLYGKALLIQKKYAASEYHLEQVLFHESQHNKGHFHKNLQALNELAHLANEQRQPQKAIQIFNQVLNAQGVDNSYKKNITIRAHMGLGQSKQELGILKEAEFHFEQAYEMNTSLNGEYSKTSAEIFTLQGKFYQSIGDIEQAQEHFNKALAIYQKILPPYHSAISQAKTKIN